MDLHKILVKNIGIENCIKNQNNTYTMLDITTSRKEIHYIFFQIS